MVLIHLLRRDVESLSSHVNLNTLLISLYHLTSTYKILSNRSSYEVLVDTCLLVYVRAGQDEEHSRAPGAAPQQEAQSENYSPLIFLQDIKT